MEDGGGVCQAILSGLSRDGLGEHWRVSFHFLRSSSCTDSDLPAKPSVSKTKARLLPKHLRCRKKAHKCL